MKEPTASTSASQRARLRLTRPRVVGGATLIMPRRGYNSAFRAWSALPPVVVSRRMRRPTILLPAVLLLAACGGRGGLPPERPPVVKGPDGTEYLLLDRGKYKGFYDRWGRLQRIEYDSNGDGKPYVIAYHDGAKSPHQLAI